jgi:hypothetical protein
MTTKNAVGNSLTGSTGTGSFVGATSPSIATPTITGLSSVTPATDDKILLLDTSNSNTTAYAIASDIGGITPASRTVFSAYAGSTQSVSNVTATKINLDSELFDIASWFDSTTNYRYTPLEAGKYLIIGSVGFQAMTDQGYLNVLIRKNGSNVAQTILTQSTATNASMASTASVIVDMNGSTDYVELFVYQSTGSSKTTFSGANITYLTGYKL